jgi:hypothetical protein
MFGVTFSSFKTFFLKCNNFFEFNRGTFASENTKNPNKLEDDTIFSKHKDPGLRETFEKSIRFNFFDAKSYNKASALGTINFLKKALEGRGSSDSDILTNDLEKKSASSTFSTKSL